MDEAAAAIRALEADRDQLAEALKPFVSAFDAMEREMFLSPDSLIVPDDMQIGLLFDEEGEAIVTISAAEFRQAQRALQKGQQI